MLWANIITLALVIANQINGKPPNAIAFGLLLTVVIGTIIAFWAIFNNKPPHNLLIYPAALANLILAIFDSQGPQTIQVALSVLILYFQIRDPIDVDPFTANYRAARKKKEKAKEERLTQKKQKNAK